MAAKSLPEHSEKNERLPSKPCASVEHGTAASVTCNSDRHSDHPQTHQSTSRPIQLGQRRAAAPDGTTPDTDNHSRGQCAHGNVHMCPALVEQPIADKPEPGVR
eukprot:CAMPEP_0204354890 /NCGR_PEP_ID=MMETSP0469-20131031/33734_1 /ASSEMBLY_ACC=CAM_ASM_000384 /TAXON_ID=2969 /ORGANISM="Oxyrrhis marina" /LENGTH=103 /DNA_ID=CAMNT_0051342053 /DNA_START=186 /DNA_END=494 /DNA_ORIENTATION=-